MKVKKQDKYLRELFRDKLENAEIIPDPTVSARIMHKLAVREFLRFNPFRLNIYYLGSVAAATIAAAILIGHARHGAPLSNSPSPVISEPSRDSIDIYRPAPAMRHEMTETGVKIRKSAPAAPKAQEGSLPVVAKEAVQRNDSASRVDLPSGRISKPLKNSELSFRQGEAGRKLQDKSSVAEQTFEVSISEGCAPLKVQFSNKLAGYDSCVWTFGDGGSARGTDPEWIYDVEGDYRVSLEAYSHDGRTLTASRTISVYPRPSAGFEINPDKIIIPDDEARFINFSAGAVRYLWNFGDGQTSELFEPVHRYEKYGNYNVTLKVFSDRGCADSLVVYNAFSRSAYFIQFPNAFIPNTGGPSGGLYSQQSDESAQVFHPSFSGVAEYNLKIFSKLGILIFESNDVNIGWDGYFKGQLSNPGVYIWKVRGKFSNGEPFTRMGDVTLLKN